MKTTNPHQPIAELIEVSKVLRGPKRETKVLTSVSFAAYPGELILLLGPSGSGKSTFLTVLAGLQPPTAGEVRLFGRAVKDYAKSAIQQLRASRIGFVFQTFHLIDSLNALENIQLVMKFAHTYQGQRRTQALDFLSQMDIAYLAHDYPPAMSQGEKQRVAVVRALANNAELIIADEPTGSLATEQGMEIVQLLQREVKTKNRCAVIASHDQRISRFADRVLYIQDGHVMENAPTVQ